jgi:hypothetical protein
MNFKEWLQLNESFELPFKVYKDILDFAVESHKKHLEKPRTKIEPKVFDLDLSGTKYDFLSIFKPSVKVSIVPPSELNGAAGWWHGDLETVGYTGADKETRSKYGNIPMLRGHISIALHDPQYSNYNSTIEHELLHFLQQLIRTYAVYKEKINHPDLDGLFVLLRRNQITNNEQYQTFRAKHGGAYDDILAGHVILPEKPWELLKLGGPKQFFKALRADKTMRKIDPLLGGLPPHALVKRVMKDRGLNVYGKKDVKRTKHAQRPMEYYTNLNTIIRTLTRWYIYAYKSQNPDIKKLAADVDLKKEYLAFLLSHKNFISNKINDVKNVDYDLYKIYMNTIAKKFLLDDSFIDYVANALNADDSIEQFKLDLENKKKEKEQAKKDKKAAKGASSIEGTRFTEKDFDGDLSIGWDDLLDLSNLEDGNYDERDNLVDVLDGRIKKDRYGDEPESLNFKLNYKKIKAMFNKLLKWRQLRDRPLLQCNVDYIAKELAKTIVSDAYGNAPNRPTADEILNMFYGPMLDCK